MIRISPVHLRNICLAGTIIFAISSCKKHSPITPKIGTTAIDTGTNTTLVGGDVYVVGYNIAADHFEQAVYWKNGTLVILPNSDPSYASAIAFQGDNVCIIGAAAEFNDMYKATYWKNGVKSLLTDSESAATAIAVSGNDLYIAGYKGSVFFVGPTFATYWKNDVAISLPDNLNMGRAFAIQVVKNDVYVAGDVGGTLGSIAAYWKDGQLIRTNSGGLLSSTANAIAVNGTDVFLAGNIELQNGKTFAAYWKNGVMIQLPVDSVYSASTAVAIAVNGNDVYIAGTEGRGDVGDGSTIAVYWKNGEAVHLSDGSTKHGSAAQGIAFDGNDLYVSGYNTTGYACYWKNRVMTNLSSGSAFSIAIVPH